MVVHEHEIAFGMIDTDFFSTNPVINFFELVVKTLRTAISAITRQSKKQASYV